jgi:hypothetical protein
LRVRIWSKPDKGAKKDLDALLTRSQVNLNGRPRTSTLDKGILPPLGTLSNAIAVARNAIEPTNASRTSRFDVFDVIKKATKQMNAHSSDHIYLNFNLMVEIKELLLPGLEELPIGASPSALNRVDTTASAVVEGKILISNNEARVLIDPGSTHSFIAMPFTYVLKLDNKATPCNVIVSTPLGEQLGSNICYKNCEIRLGSVVLTGDLICLPIVDYDRYELVVLALWASRLQEKDHTFL